MYNFFNYFPLTCSSIVVKKGIQIVLNITKSLLLDLFLLFHRVNGFFLLYRCKIGLSLISKHFIR